MSDQENAWADKAQSLLVRAERAVRLVDRSGTGLADELRDHVASRSDGVHELYGARVRSATISIPACMVGAPQGDCHQSPGHKGPHDWEPVDQETIGCGYCHTAGLDPAKPHKCAEFNARRLTMLEQHSDQEAARIDVLEARVARMGRLLVDAGEGP